MSKPTHRLVLTLDTRRAVSPIEQFTKAVLKLAGRTFGMRVTATTTEDLEHAAGEGAQRTPEAASNRREVHDAK